MNIDTCKKHGAQLFTEPGRNPNCKSYCVKCVANGVSQSPKSFILTDSFWKMITRIDGKAP